MKLSSTAFAHAEAIPQHYTDDGADVSPPLEWGGMPEGTVELALIVDDPDAPTAEPWVHWVLYGIPADCGGIEEGVSREKSPPEVPGASQGLNSWDSDNIGYRGPAPPPGHGVHRYRFRLYALGRAVGLPPGAGKKQLLAAMGKADVLAETELVGFYER